MACQWWEGTYTVTMVATRVTAAIVSVDADSPVAGVYYAR